MPAGLRAGSLGACLLTLRVVKHTPSVLLSGSQANRPGGASPVTRAEPKCCSCLTLNPGLSSGLADRQLSTMATNISINVSGSEYWLNHLTVG